MKKINCFILIIFFIVLFIPNSLFSQQKTKIVTKEDNGLTTINFETEKGEIKVYLPTTLYAGDIISGTVIAKPNGKSEEQIAKNKNILNGYVIGLENKEMPVKQGKEKWKIPDLVKNGILMLVLKSPIGEVLGKTEVPANDELRQLDLPDKLDDTCFEIPDFIEAGKPIYIPGYFDGDFSTSGISINNMNTNILAESPEGIFFEAPEDLAGVTVVKIEEQDFTMEEETNILNLDLTADKLTLIKGEIATVLVHVDGLEGLETDVPLEVSNLTPQNINLVEGNQQIILIEPADISEEGTFQHELSVSAIDQGGFSVMVNIIPPLLDEVFALDPETKEMQARKIPPADKKTNEMIQEVIDLLSNPHFTLVEEDWKRVNNAKELLKKAQDQIKKGNKKKAKQLLKLAKSKIEKATSLPKQTRDNCIKKINEILKRK